MVRVVFSIYYPIKSVHRSETKQKLPLLCAGFVDKRLKIVYTNDNTYAKWALDRHMKHKSGDSARFFSDMKMLSR